MRWTSIYLVGRPHLSCSKHRSLWVNAWLNQLSLSEIMFPVWERTVALIRLKRVQWGCSQLHSSCRSLVKNKQRPGGRGHFRHYFLSSGGSTRKYTGKVNTTEHIVLRSNVFACSWTHVDSVFFEDQSSIPHQNLRQKCVPQTRAHCKISRPRSSNRDLWARGPQARLISHHCRTQRSLPQPGWLWMVPHNELNSFI